MPTPSTSPRNLSRPRPGLSWVCISWLLYAAITWVVPAEAQEGNGQVQYSWPLRVDPEGITGTFMEPRSAHYHSGLDIKTQARTGLPVYAPAAGSVVRLRVSPEGYGKALYLRLEDGRTLVFAHLNYFCDRLQAAVTKAQEKDRSYEQDLHFEPGRLVFESQQLLALSGDTGTGAPHLHMELRGVDGRPRNPLTHGFNAPDREAPTIGALRLVPLSADARIEGHARRHEFKPGARVIARGRLGLQVDVQDKTGIYPHRLMPLGLEVTLDGRPVVSVEQREFAFGQGRQMRLEVVPDATQPRRRWFRLYKRQGNDLPGREFEHESATFDVAADGHDHEVRVRAWDAKGNETIETFTLVAAGAAPLVRPARRLDFDRQRLLRDGPWALQVTPREDLFEIEVLGQSSVAASELSHLEVVALQPDRAPAVATATETDDGHLCASLVYDSLESGPIRFALRIRGEELPLNSQDGQFLLGRTRTATTLHEFESGHVRLSTQTNSSLFEGGAIWVETGSRPKSLPEGTRFRGRAWRVRGAGVAFSGELDLSVDLAPGDADRRVGLFHLSPRGKWTFLGAEPTDRPSVTDERARVAGLGAPLDATGLVCLLVDADPPYLGEFSASGRPLTGSLPRLVPLSDRDYRGVTLPRWPTLELPLADPGAGLEADDVVCRLDGRPFPARWDPEEDRLYVDFFVDPGEGAHRLEVEVADRLGNRNSKSLNFELRTP